MACRVERRRIRHHFESTLNIQFARRVGGGSGVAFIGKVGMISRSYFASASS